MYVKLAFSVAAHLDSEIMIMDEVLAVGDMAFQKKCLDKMRDAAKKEGRTVLYVSHNMNTIRQLCDRCVVLDKGRVVYEGDVESAISVYMNCDDESKVEYDYSEIPRSPYESRKIELLGATILDKENNKVQKGENLQFVFHCRCKENAYQIGFRFEIFAMDGSIVGTAFSDKLISLEAGVHADIHICLPTKNFATGKYKVVALAYERNEYGYQVGVDRVAPAMYFEVLDENEESLAWLHQYWGNVHFDDMIIRDIQII